MDPETTPQPQNAPEQSAPAAAAAPQDDGFIRVPKADWEKANGARSFYESAQRHGFKNPEDLDSFAPLATAVRGRQINPHILASILQGGGQDDAGGDEPDEIKSEVARLRRHYEVSAQSEYDSMSRSEQKAVKDLAKKLAGDGADAYTISLHEKALMFDAAQARQDYEDGHALRGKKWRPLDSDSVNGLGSTYETLRAQAKGQSQAALADAAAKKPPVSPTAGRSGAQGAEGKDSDNKTHVRFDKRTPEERRRVLEEIQNRKGPQGRRPLATM